MGCAQTKQLSTVVNKADLAPKSRIPLMKKEMKSLLIKMTVLIVPIIVLIIEMRSRRKAIVAKTWEKSCFPCQRQCC